MHCSPWVYNTDWPDPSSLKRLLAHPRFEGKTGEALAIEIWRYTVDPVCGFYHFWSPADREIDRPYMPLDYVKDPLKLINSYGFMLCGTVAAVFANLCEAAGIPARIIGVTGHTLNEAYFDGGWHLFDCDMCGYYRKRDGDHAIASLKECLADPSLISEPYEKIEPYGLPDRSPEGIADGCYGPGKGGPMPRHVQPFHEMSYVLRPGESLVRYARSVNDRWHFPPHWIKEGKKRYPTEWKASGARERFPPHRTYCNGVFRYEPDLTDQTRDVELGAWNLENVAATLVGLAPKDPDNTGRATFLIHSPWVITGRPLDTDHSENKVEGVRVKFGVQIPTGNQSEVSLLFSTDGDMWEEIECVKKSGNSGLEVDLTKHLDRLHRGLLAIDLKGAAILKYFKSETWFSFSHNSYPYLGKGGKNFAYHGGGEEGGAGTSTLTEPWSAELEEGEETFQEAFVSTENVKRGEAPFNRISQQDPALPWSAVCRVAPRVLSPLKIKRAKLWASLASYKGNEDAPPSEYLEKNLRAKLEASTSPEGPWTLIKEENVPLHEQGYHFCVDGDYVPESEGEEGVPEVYLKVTSPLPGWEIRAAVTCALPKITGPVPPLEIVHHWKEGGQDKSHREVLEDSLASRQYMVSTGEGEIRDVRIEFNVPHAT